MNLLIDSHVLLWWWNAQPKLTGSAAKALLSSSNRIYVSSAVAWELAIKVNLGKLDARDLISNLSRLLSEEGFHRLAISTDHAVRAGMLPRHHSDPFDRMLIAQAQAHNFAVVSADTAFDRYGVTRIW
jgi:PIN domain nuclease of toxin-antitoxin system